MKETIFIFMCILSFSLYSQVEKEDYRHYRHGDFNDTIEWQRYENAKRLSGVSWQIFKNRVEQPIYHRTVIDTLCYDSICFSYFPNGQIKRIDPYIDGVLNGYAESYHFNGQLECRVRMINGKEKDGYIIFYNEDGSIRTEGKMKNGKQVGNWYNSPYGGLFSKRTYNSKGILVDEKRWNGDKKRWERGFKATIFEKLQIFFRKLQ